MPFPKSAARLENLQRMPSGSKTLRFKYHLGGERKKVTIGASACPKGEGALAAGRARGLAAQEQPA